MSGDRCCQGNPQTCTSQWNYRMLALGTKFAPFFHAKARKFFKFSTEIKRDGRVFFVSILPKEFQYINRGNNNKKRQKQWGGGTTKWFPLKGISPRSTVRSAKQNVCSRLCRLIICDGCYFISMFSIKLNIFWYFQVFFVKRNNPPTTNSNRYYTEVS